ncbi:hypothetical protein C7S13_8653 [Burkholderia cepacia]|nr:hypothetical protein [Burkholderia cepacia]MDW9245887.1 hypothetical protein [Burkholderia cepacia]
MPYPAGGIFISGHNWFINFLLLHGSIQFHAFSIFYKHEIPDLNGIPRVC